MSYLVLPDLRGFSTEEIDWLYEEKISVWKIQEYVGRAAEEVLAMEANLEREKGVSV